MRRILFILSLLLLPGLHAAAQEDVFYRLELGGGLGLGFSLNDVNSKFYGGSNVAAGLLARFPLNPRMALKASVSYSRLSGTVAGLADFYPADLTTTGTTPLDYSMSGSLLDVSALYELHFLPYGWVQGYQGLKRITPYIQLGAGLTYGTPGKAFTVNLPLGVGLKWKVKDRINVGLDWTFHFTPSDKLDGLEAPHGIGSSEFRNKDHYSLTMLTVTYDLSPKCPTCNKDNR